MEIDKFEKCVIAGDVEAFRIWNSIQDKQQLLPSAFRLLKHPNPETRNIAANCLADVKSLSVEHALADALKDPSEEVRGTAFTYLDVNSGKPIVPELLKNLSTYDASIRAGVALIIGRLGDNSMLVPLTDAYEKEKVPQSKRNIGLAMAKLGDEQLKEFFVEPLIKGIKTQQYQAIEDLTYICDKHMARQLLPALDNMQDAHIISAPQQLPQEYARVCDAAITLVGRLYDNPFSFKTGNFKVYSLEEIEEAKKFLMTLRQ